MFHRLVFFAIYSVYLWNESIYLLIKQYGNANSYFVSSSTSLGTNYNCLVNGKGVLKCYGRGDSGQLGLEDANNKGDDSNEMREYLPYVKVGSGVTVKSVFCGGSHTCVILSDDSAKCWGLNDSGQLGLGVTTSKVGDNSGEMGDYLPNVNLGSQSKIISFALGNKHTCGLFLNKNVKCWGKGSFGQLGYENTNSLGTDSSQMGSSLAFVYLGTNAEVTNIYSSGLSEFTCVILSSQYMKCWGSGGNWQLGYGDIVNRGATANSMGNFLPTVDLGTESRVKSISVGGLSACAIRIDDELKCWGDNYYGKLGTGNENTVSSMGTSLVSTAVDATGTYKAYMVATGSSHTCILLNDMLSVKCIGFNNSGQLGQGDITNRGGSSSTTADKFPAINLGTGSLQIVEINVSSSSSCVQFIDNSVKCFGSGTYGVLGQGNTNSFGDSVSTLGSNLPFVNIFVSTPAPTKTPTTGTPTIGPSTDPTKTPTRNPTPVPTGVPTKNPSQSPTSNPTKSPTLNPSPIPTLVPSSSPTTSPTLACQYPTSKLCNLDLHCSWEKVKKKKQCVLLNCSSLSKKKCTKEKIRCNWNKINKICTSQIL